MTSDTKTGTTSVGTGFLYQAKLNTTEDNQALFLISNRHVFINPSCKISLTFHKVAADNATPNMTEVLNVEQKGFGSLYTDHPDPEIDLACLNVSPIVVNNPNIFYRCLNSHLLSDCSDARLFAGKEVFFAGYPDNRFDTAHHLPILRRGYIASMPSINFGGKQQFVVDAQVFPGSSGSPVFVEYNTQFRLLGVITATMVKNERLQPITPTQATSIQDFGIRQTIGLGIVIKSEALKNLLNIAVDATTNLINST